MMKQQLLLVFTGPMELGGIERSLLGLMDAIDYDQFDVDLFLYGHHGPLFSQINPNVHLLPEVKELAYLQESFVSKIKHGCWYSSMLRLRDTLISPFKQTDYYTTWAQITKKRVEPLQKNYDLAIGFFRPFDLIIEKVHATKKVGWIHTDYYHAGENLENIERDYARLDAIAAVSEDCAKGFASLFPRLQERIVTIENILSAPYVIRESKAPITTDEMPDDGCIRLLTVGRFSPQKNMVNIPDICSRIRKKGLDVKWYLIGYGAEEEKIRREIQNTGMQDYVIIMGKKDNPYPYMAQSDVYVQPSNYEGKSVCVREAQMLCKPVVITDYDTSGSQLQDGVDGLIVPLNNAECASGIISLLQDPDRMKELAQNCSQRDYSNSSEIKKIYDLIQ